MTDVPSDDDMLDKGVDDEIVGCLIGEKTKSFFLFAGAGSGKTRSLVNALGALREKKGEGLAVYGKRVGVITYTNAAKDEIDRRIDFDPVFHVSTIHSFAWSLICHFHTDIKHRLEGMLRSDIADLEAKQAKGKPNSKAALDREKSILVKTRRLSELGEIKQFTYSPNGENREKESLNHAEVLDLFSWFLKHKALMRDVLVQQYPILLIDESQDTHRPVIESLMLVENIESHRFSMGLFGDTMQKIYGHGKPNLGGDVPPRWATPSKKMNHRCPERVVMLINRIRESVDDHSQKARADKAGGIVRLFVVRNNAHDKAGIEEILKSRMAEISGDEKWIGEAADVKTLILEHHMAARRMGFLNIYEPLYKVESLRTSLLDGSLPGLRLFTHFVHPLVKARTNGDSFAEAAVVRKSSPLLSKSTLSSPGVDQLAAIKEAKLAVDSLLSLWANNTPVLKDVLRKVAETGLFVIPNSLRPITERTTQEQQLVDKETLDDEDGSFSELDAWDKALQASFSEVEPYSRYVSGASQFDTHQGVKGLEFERVLVVIDDKEARGFQFGYDKLFGAQEKTPADLKNEKDGKETTLDRTRRLFYVTCSRAEKSLAIVAYTSDPKKVKEHVIHDGWFFENEVEEM